MFRASLFSTVLILLFSSCQNSYNNFETILPSPDSKKHLYFNLNEGEPYYLLYFEDHILVDWSKLGFLIDDTIKLNEGLLKKNIETRTSSFSEEYALPKGIELDLATFNEMTITLDKQDYPGIQVSLVMRIYDNAVVFKYNLNFKGGNRTVQEITELDFYKNLFREVEIEKITINEISKIELPIEEVDTLFLPTTFISNESYKLEYLESVSPDYPKMKLLKRTPDKAEFQMKYADDSVEKINVKTGFETPWRIVYITAYNE